MEQILIINIKQLLQAGEHIALKRGSQMKNLDILENAFLYIEGERISDYGRMDEMPANLQALVARSKDPHSDVKVIDAAGRMVMPAFCDSHTHLVYAGSREQEFVDKINGLSYQEIAARGGGILNSAQLLGETSEEELYQSALNRAKEIMATGTGAVEIKSGYGLTPENEIKMLRVIKRLKETTPLTVKSTFLGAHAFPAKYANDKNGYIEEIINTMIPMVAAEDLAEFVDVFCEE